MQSDWDVGHIIAKANGGANHPVNYIPMCRGYNRRLQHLHDGVIFGHIPDEDLREAVCASRVQTGCTLTLEDCRQDRKEALSHDLLLFVQGLGQVGGGHEEIDGFPLNKDWLCDRDYCHRLVTEWNPIFQ